MTDDPDNVHNDTVFQTFHYELLDNHSTLFTIRNATLYNIRSFDYETKKYYKLKIKVNDSGFPSLTLVKDINVKVLGKLIFFGSS